MKTYNFLVLSAEGSEQIVEINEETKQAALKIMEIAYP